MRTGSAPCARASRKNACNNDRFAVLLFKLLGLAGVCLAMLHYLTPLPCSNACAHPPSPCTTVTCSICMCHCSVHGCDSYADLVLQHSLLGSAESASAFCQELAAALQAAAQQQQQQQAGHGLEGSPHHAQFQASTSGSDLPNQHHQVGCTHQTCSQRTTPYAEQCHACCHPTAPPTYTVHMA